MQENKLYHTRLKRSGLRATRQRLEICKVLFNRKKTFHFTIEKLKEITEKNCKCQISLATLYNTVHAFKRRGYLREIALNNNKTFFDTNTESHHHFFDENLSELIDIKDKDIVLNKLPSAPTGKKINKVEIIIRVASSNQNQSKN